MKSTRIKAKEKAWDACSIYVRTLACSKHGWKTMWVDAKDGLQKEVPLALCFTCGKEYPAFGKGCLQAGHFIPGRNASVLLDERGIHAQCYNCNVNLKGNPRKYQLRMVEEYGQDLVDELDALSEETMDFSEDDYKGITEYFKNKTKELEDLT